MTAVRMDEVNEAPRDYYVLPSIDMTFGKRCELDAVIGQDRVDAIG